MSEQRTEQTNVSAEMETLVAAHDVRDTGAGTDGEGTYQRKDLTEERASLVPHGVPHMSEQRRTEQEMVPKVIFDRVAEQRDHWREMYDAAQTENQILSAWKEQATRMLSDVYRVLYGAPK